MCSEVIQRAGESRAGDGTRRGRRGGVATAAPVQEHSQDQMVGQSPGSRRR